MSNLRQWLALILMVTILVACTPAETTSDSPTSAPDAAQETEEATATPTPTSVPVEPGEMDEPTSTPTRLTLEIAPEAPTKPAPAEEINPMPQDATAVPPTDPYSLQLIDMAKTDLAEHLDIEKDEIVLHNFSLLTWPDASLGCPKPGVEYAQVLVDGYLIMLQVGLDIYNYHGGGSPGSSPFLCEGDIGTKIIFPPPD